MLSNYQTMICDLTKTEVCASSLDDAAAAAEAMILSFKLNSDKSKNRFLISSSCHPHVIAVCQVI